MISLAGIGQCTRGKERPTQVSMAAAGAAQQPQRHRARDAHALPALPEQPGFFQDLRCAVRPQHHMIDVFLTQPLAQLRAHFGRHAKGRLAQRKDAPRDSGNLRRHPDRLPSAADAQRADAVDKGRKLRHLAAGVVIDAAELLLGFR